MTILNYLISIAALAVLVYETYTVGAFAHAEGDVE